MRHIILSLSTLLIATVSYSQEGFDWAKTCGHPFYGETNTRLTVDGSDNIYMAGSFTDTAYFDDQSLISSGGTDIFFARYDAAGNVKWLMRDGGGNYDYVHGIAVDEEGIFACGSFYGSTQVGNDTYKSEGSQYIFLARYDLTGNPYWTRHIHSPKTDFVKALSTDPSGNMIITGYYYDSIAFSDTTIYAAGGSDIFLAKYSSSGDRLWLQQAGGPYSDQSYSLSSDSEGNILFTGSYFEEIQLGDTMLTTLDPTGVFLAKLNPQGELLHVLQADGNGLTAESFAAFDQDGNIFFTGNFSGQLTVGPYFFDAGAFNVDIFITKYSPDFELQWADHGYGIGSDQLKSIATGPENDLYISGHYLSDLHFSDLTFTYTLCCGSAEIFMVRYTADGTPVWGEQISGERALAESMYKNASNELFISGMFEFQLAFGDIILESTNGYRNFLAGVYTGTTTAIPESDAADLRIYPVPARDHIMLDLRGKGILRFEIIDMSGKVPISGVTSGQEKIDISGLPPGQYFIRVSDENSGWQAAKTILKY
jgi:hypothetical protein